MIIKYNPLWLNYLKDIDVKSYNYTWLDEDWAEIEKWIIKIWMLEKQPRGFAALRFDKGDKIIIAKLAVHPRHRGQGGGTALLENVEAIAKFRYVKRLTALLHEDNEFKDWMVARGFKAARIEKRAFPDGDGYHFCKEIE